MPKTLTVTERIAKLHALEERARRIQQQQDNTRREWGRHIDILRNTPEWKEHCQKNGLYSNYDFGDVLS